MSSRIGGRGVTRWSTCDEVAGAAEAAMATLSVPGVPGSEAFRRRTRNTKRVRPAAVAQRYAHTVPSSGSSDPPKRHDAEGFAAG